MDAVSGGPRGAWVESALSQPKVNVSVLIVNLVHSFIILGSFFFFLKSMIMMMIMIMII